MSNIEIFNAELMDWLSEIIVVIDAENRIVFINRAAESHYEWTRQCVIGEDYVDLCKRYGYSFSTDVDDSRKHEFAHGEPRSCTFRALSGEEKSARWRVIKDRSGVIGGMRYLLGRDSTAQVRSEEELAFTRRMFQAIIDSVEGKYWSKDIKGRYIAANTEFAKSVGFRSVDEVLGMTDHDAPWSETAEQLLLNDLQVISSGCPQVYEEKVRSEVGASLTFLVRKAPLRNPKGEIVGTIGSSVDITSLKRSQLTAEEALSSEAKARDEAAFEATRGQAIALLSGSIAHDLRTLISILEINGRAVVASWAPLVRGYELAAAADLPVETISPAKLKTLSSVGEDIAEIARDMHDFVDSTVRFIHGILNNKMELQPHLCSMRNCVTGAVKHYLGSVKQSDVFDIKDVDFTFAGDEVLTTKILSNLIDNALREIRAAGSGKIIISHEVRDEENVLIFRDTVGNLHTRELNRLFKTRVGDDNRGSGIGLAFCKLAMRGFGGDIVCQSEYGSYVDFVLTFPKVSGQAGAQGVRPLTAVRSARRLA